MNKDKEVFTWSGVLGNSAENVLRVSLVRRGQSLTTGRTMPAPTLYARQRPWRRIAIGFGDLGRFFGRWSSAHVEEKIAGRGRRDLMDGKGNDDEYITNQLVPALPCLPSTTPPRPRTPPRRPPAPATSLRTPAGRSRRRASEVSVCCSGRRLLTIARRRPLPFRYPLTCPFPRTPYRSRAHGSLPSAAPRRWTGGSWRPHVGLLPAPGTRFFCSGREGNYQSPCPGRPPSRARTVQSGRPVSPLLVPRILFCCSPILFPTPPETCPAFSCQFSA